MTKPENFIQTTDYATLKNDDRGTMQLVMPTNLLILTTSSYTFETFLNVGTRNASVRVRMKSDRYTGEWAVGNSLVTRITYNMPPIGTFDDPFVATVERVSPSTLRLYLTISNNTPYPVTTTGPTQTITAEIRTFLSPFE